MSIATVRLLAAMEHDPDGVRDVARDVLSRSPFIEHAPTAAGRVIRRVLESIGEALGRLLQAAGSGSITAWLIVVVATALLVLVVWRWTRGVSVDLVTTPDAIDPSGRSAAAWLESSQQAQDRGELTTALRERYLAVVATLVERGILEDEPGRTIRELDAQLASRRPDLHEAVAAAGSRLERVSYAGVAARQDDIEVADAALHELGVRPVART